MRQIYALSRYAGRKRTRKSFFRRRDVIAERFPCRNEFEICHHSKGIYDCAARTIEALHADCCAIVGGFLLHSMRRFALLREPSPSVWSRRQRFMFPLGFSALIKYYEIKTLVFAFLRHVISYGIFEALNANCNCCVDPNYRR